MKIASSNTIMFQAKIRIMLRRKIRVLLGSQYKNIDIRKMQYKELEQFFNLLKYGKKV